VEEGRNQGKSAYDALKDKGYIKGEKNDTLFKRCNLNDAFFSNPYLMKSFIVYWHAIVFAVGLKLSTIMESIFGKCSSRAVMEMPFNLNSLVSNLPVNCPYTADDLIYNHTLYPFFTAFLPKEGQKK